MAMGPEPKHRQRRKLLLAILAAITLVLALAILFLIVRQTVDRNAEKALISDGETIVSALSQLTEEGYGNGISYNVHDVNTVKYINMIENTAFEEGSLSDLAVDENGQTIGFVYTDPDGKRLVYNAAEEETPLYIKNEQ
jgi:hypothetical protein